MKTLLLKALYFNLVYFNKQLLDEEMEHLQIVFHHNYGYLKH